MPLIKTLGAIILFSILTAVVVGTLEAFEIPHSGYHAMYTNGVFTLLLMKYFE